MFYRAIMSINLIATLWETKCLMSSSVLALMKFSASLSKSSSIPKFLILDFEQPASIIFTLPTRSPSTFLLSEVVSPPPYFRLLFFGFSTLLGYKSHKFFKLVHFLFVFIKVTIKNMVPTRKCDVLGYTFWCAPMFTKFTVKHLLRPLRPRTPTSSQVP